MKRVEITYRTNVNELNKLNARLERAEKSYQKKLANAEKYGVADMTNEEHLEWLRTVPTTEMGMIINNADVKKNGAWYDLYRAERELEEAKEAIEKSEKRFEKAYTALQEYQEEIAKIADLQEKEKLMKLEFEQEQKEWMKDGITLDGRYYGKTPKGKSFSIDINNGWTQRSFHCYTLYINGNCIFTSGEFWRAYGIVKNS